MRYSYNGLVNVYSDYGAHCCMPYSVRAAASARTAAVTSELNSALSFFSRSSTIRFVFSEMGYDYFLLVISISGGRNGFGGECG